MPIPVKRLCGGSIDVPLGRHVSVTHISFTRHYYSYPNGFIVYACTDDTPMHMQQPFLRKVLPYITLSSVGNLPV